ncbi:MAG: family 78 glycoside hydrolase catalytic domain [Acidobacteriaceae bacterium]
MMKPLVLFTLLFALAAPSLHAASGDTVHLVAPAQLRCDQQADPLAIPSAEPTFAWQLAASSTVLRGVSQSAYRILVASSPQLLAGGHADVWDSGMVRSRETFNIPYAGKALQPEQTYFWKVRAWDEQGVASAWSRTSSFTVAPARLAAQWISAPDRSEDEGNAIPMPLFRDAFHLKQKPWKATLYISGLGQYEVHLNGHKVGDDELAPAWTDYRKTVSYDAYDVTALLRSGAQALGVLLGNGMYNVRKTPKRYTKFVATFGPPKLIAQMRITFADGSSTLVTSGTSWKTTSGPITFSSTYGGEDYDARRNLPGWDAPGFNDATWLHAVIVDGPGGALQPGMTAPIRVMATYTAIKKTEPKPGIVVYDLGQNFAGWPAIRVRGPRGATIRLTPGELLHAAGTVSQRGSGGPQWFSYTLAGHGVEAWHPRFSYYGFRYVQAQWDTSKDHSTVQPEVISLIGQAVHSSAPSTGNFASSESMLNRIHALILAAIHNNTESLLTDCPHREKLGWLEQTHLLGSALMYDNDLQRLYQALSRNIADAQKPDGMVPTIAPQYTSFQPPYDYFNDSPEWGSAAVLAPWYAYQHYGDRASLATAYPVMQRYVEYLTSRAKDGIVNYGLGDWYDIGPKDPGVSQLTSLGLTATAIYYQDLAAMTRIAEITGHSADAVHYRKQAAEVRAAFNAKFYHANTHSYDHGSQTSNAMPLVLGLVPHQDRAAVLANLVADIHAHQDHVTAGDVGFHYVVAALEDNGRSDVLLAMLLRTDPPSYGAQLAAGATALTEAWDANPHNSQDHFMLGDAEEWFYHGLAGIDFDMSRSFGTAAHAITIRPAVLPGVASATASYDSVLGKIRSAWHHQGDAVIFDITIPANTIATVVLPVTHGASVTESGHALAKEDGITRIGHTDATEMFSVASGTYHFKVN